MEGKKRSVENTPLDKTSRFEAISDMQTRLGNILPKDIIFIDQGLYTDNFFTEFYYFLGGLVL